MGAIGTLLLLHPAGYDARFWGAATRVLEPSFEVIAPDRLGHGSHIDELRLRRAQARTADEYRELLAKNRGDTDEVEWLESLLESAGHGALYVAGSGDAGILALKLAARSRRPVQATVLVETAVLLPEDISLEAILAGLEASELDHLGLADAMAQVLATKDPAAYVEWAMNQPSMALLPAEGRTLVESMIADNTLPALFATTSHQPGDLDSSALAAITGPVLALHTDPFPESDQALDSLLTRTTLIRETLPPTPPMFPLSAPQNFADRVTRFVRDPQHLDAHDVP